MNSVKLSVKEARALATYASKLHGKPFKRKVKKEDLMEMISHLGMVQLDTISVVTRAHETALFSRLGAYDLALWQDLFHEKKITEYLAHAAAIVPTEDIPLMKGMMEYYKNYAENWLNHEERKAVVDAVLQRIQEEGALSSRHFEGPRNENAEAWSSWYGPKIERKILSYLHWGGDILISLREPSFNKWYDLPQRVLPEEIYRREIPEESEELLAKKAMKALGISTINWFSDYYRTGGKSYLNHRESSQMLKKLQEKGECISAEVEGIKVPLYLSKEYLPYLEALRQGRGWPSRTTFLSPFDNLIFNRRRMKELWNMEYTIEIYTPAEKRIYGYYTMPILHKGDLIGRLDPSLDRKKKILHLKSLHLEQDKRITKGLVHSLHKALQEFSNFLGAEQWILHETTPSRLKELLG